MMRYSYVHLTTDGVDVHIEHCDGKGGLVEREYLDITESSYHRVRNLIKWSSGCIVGPCGQEMTVLWRTQRCR